MHYHFHARLKAAPDGQRLDTDENLVPLALTAAELDRAIETGAIDDGKTIILWDLYRRAHAAGAC